MKLVQRTRLYILLKKYRKENTELMPVKFIVFPNWKPLDPDELPQFHT
jgi:hypothetical protein